MWQPFLTKTGLFRTLGRIPKLAYSRTWRKTLEFHVRKSVGIDFLSDVLDLGSGPEPTNSFGSPNCMGIDLFANPEKQVSAADLSLQPIPFQDSSFGLLTAFDFLEHVPRTSLEGARTRFPFVELMNEVHRVLKPGGYFFSLTPVYPHGAAFQDPTHVNLMTSKTLSLYFCGDAWAEMYGFAGAFVLRDSGWMGHHHWSLLRRA